MTNVIEFLNTKAVTKSKIYKHLKCKAQEAKILQHLSKEYIQGNDNVLVLDVLTSIYNIKNYEYLEKLNLIKNLLELGWIVQTSFNHFKITDISKLEILNAPISLSHAFLKLLEIGSLDLNLPKNEPYSDHLEYLQDQFLRINLYQKHATLKQNYDTHSPSVKRLKNKLTLLENRINERVNSTKIKIDIQDFFKENRLNEKEQLIFLALLKEEYSNSEETLRDMNTLIEIISYDDYDRIRNRALLEENSTLIKNSLIDYDEVLTPFGGISRNFFIPEDTLQSISNHNRNKKEKIKLDMLVKEEGMFELIEPKTTLNDVVLHKDTRELLDGLLKQMDTKVIKLLKEWGIRDKNRGIDAKIIFYGHPGTGKSMTAYSLGKSLKKPIISFDCSKILSMYIGESEKNVRKIFDDFKDFAQKSKTEPILLLNEADQFLSSRSTGDTSGASKMHNQMQNIFLEQIEKFDGILIATTNLLENIDKAFSRRFNYKIEFKKPTPMQRLKIWQLMLPQNADYEESFDIDKLASYELTGGQIDLILKNTSYKVAIKDEPIFCMSDFLEEIKNEKKGDFGDDKSMGFLSRV